MAEALPTGSKTKKVWVITGIVGAILLAVAAGGALRYFTSRNDTTPARRDPKALPAIVNDVQNLRLEGNVAQAEAKIQDALKNPTTSTKERYMLYIQQGSGHEDTGNMQAAIDSYLQAEAIQATFDVTQLLAEAYARMGNSPKAIEYYKKAIILIPQNNPVRDDDIAAYKQKIVNLGGQP